MQEQFVLHCRGRVIDCSHATGRVHVMGILNVTPDSFSDGGRYADPDVALRRVEEMVTEGATIVDVGGESSRPRGSVYGTGAAPVTEEEEKRRVVPVVEAAVRRFPELVVSVDTCKSDVAEAALSAGASMLNDITGLRADPRMADVAASAGVPLVVMHSVGTPGALEHERSYGDVVEEVLVSLRQSAVLAQAAGVQQVIVDPGFGFGKTVEENLRLVAEMDRFVDLGWPVLIGISRKSAIGAVVGTKERPVPVGDRLHGTLGATAVAVWCGARLVRTHDVRPTVELVRVVERVRGSEGPRVRG